MNPELQNLIDVALVDGYISDKEQQILKKKAEKLGFNPDEFDMILEAKIFELQNKKGSRINKCPNCGEVITGLNRVCPSCDYVLNAGSVEKDPVTLQDGLKAYNQSVVTLQNLPKTNFIKNINTAVLILLTGGLYIIFVVFIRKQNPFDSYSQLKNKIIYSTDVQADLLLAKYGDDKKIKTLVTDLVAKRNSVLKKRRVSTYTSAMAALVIAWGTVFAVAAFVPWKEVTVFKGREESPSEKTERLIVQNRIGEAKAALQDVTDLKEKKVFSVNIAYIEIDSLLQAEAFDAALEVALTIKDNTMQQRIDLITEKKVDHLIKEGDFAGAYEAAELASHPNKLYLTTSVKVAEALQNTNKKKK